MTDPTARLSAFEPARVPPAPAGAAAERRLLRRGGHRHRPDAVGPQRLWRTRRLCRSCPTTEDEDRILTRLSERVSPRVLRQPGELDEARTQLEAFLAGRTREFSLRTDLALASDFQRTVLPRLAATVGYGDRATYGELAARVERPSAARAVGRGPGREPVVRRAPLPPDRRLERRPDRVCRWAGRQALPPRARGRPPLGRPPEVGCRRAGTGGATSGDASTMADRRGPAGRPQRCRPATSGWR